MKLDIRAFGFAAGTVVAAFFLVCSATYRVAPQWYARQYTLFMHVDLARYGQQPGWGNVVLGTVGWGVGVAVLSGLVAWVYDRSARA